MDLELKGKRALVTGGSCASVGDRTRARARRRDVALLARDPVVLAAAADNCRPSRSASWRQRRHAQRQAVAWSTGRTRGGAIDISLTPRPNPPAASPPKRQHRRVLPRRARHRDEHVARAARSSAACAPPAGPSSTSAAWRRPAGSAVGSMRNAALVALTKNMADEPGPAGINVTVVHLA
jgi:hypothetical protein